MDYEILKEQVEDLLKAEPYFVSAMANISALLMESMDELNWAGFYLMKDGHLTVGPFQGKPACIRIPVGKGVCGTAVLEKRSLLVKDVHEFEGHIACDSASESELVVPLFQNGEVIGVLDMDSPRKGRFTEEDLEGLSRIAEIIGGELSFS